MNEHCDVYRRRPKARFRVCLACAQQYDSTTLDPSP